ncbi:hypothetical protein [Anaerosporobacter sp.]
MERLTKQWGKDNCNCVPTKLDYGELLDIDEDSFSEVNKIVRKLAAYEDTGLTPDVCNNYKLFEDELISKGITFSELLEYIDGLWKEKCE